MHSRRWFLIIFLVYLLGFFAHALYLKKTVYGDGVFYYSWLRSLVVDHNINFTNEYEYFHINQPMTATGLLANKYAIGPALFWAAPFLVTHTVVGGTGYELPYQLHVGATSVFFALFGLALLYRLLRQFFKEIPALFTTLTIAFATNLFFYGSLDTVNSHALSFFAATLYLTFLVQKKRNWVAIGLSLGLLGIIRTQDLLYAVLLVPFAVHRGLFLFIIGLFVGFLPQIISWQALYGTFWASPYITGGESFNLLRPHVLSVLFSTKSGLFLYAPILLLGTIGLFFWKNKLRQWVLAVIILELFVVSTWSTWWQGASYGGRMFVSSLPLFAFGIAWVFEWLSRRGWNQRMFIFTLIAPLALLNVLLMIRFLLIT
ncbi:glycosyltransferase family 39 protein [Candidatus Gottesmanbacteria bacterium]|nr:glycosyltransferase family 39 protein [Candidatus Gottesmanbacteria bacterium]